MHRSNKQQRSRLALAGQLSINSPSRYVNPNEETNGNNLSSQQILKRLTLPRLRKMQALVRGFIVRRTIYPRQLQKYLIAQSILDLLSKNVIYGFSSEILVEAVTYTKYEGDHSNSVQRQLEEYFYNQVMHNVFKKQLQPLIRQAILQKGRFLSRPQITFGLNMRHPTELVLYQTLNNIIQEECLQIAKESIHYQAIEVRQLRIMQQWLQNFDLISNLCNEVMEECLSESMGQFIIAGIIERVVHQGAMVIGKVMIEQQLQRIQSNEIDMIVRQAQQWLLQQTIGNKMELLNLGIKSQVKE